MLARRYRRLLSVSVILAAVALGTAGARAEEPIEHVKRTIGARLVQPEGYEILAADGDSAVVGVTAVLPPQLGEGRDQAPAQRMNVYFYLAKAGEGWTVTGTRSALQAGLRLAAEQLRVTPTGMLARTLRIGEAEAEGYQSRLLLATSTDDVLLAHFRDKRAVFGEIARLVARPDIASGERIVASNPDHAKLFAEALVEYAERSVPGSDRSEASGCSDPGCFTLTVAASPPAYRVGYFHVADPTRTPRMSERRYLVVRPLGDGWYFFRRS